MIIKNGLVYQERVGFVPKTVAIAHGVFTKEPVSGEEIDATGCYVIPGLVDIHFHGAVGYDFCDHAPEMLSMISEYELRQGITSICPTTCAMPVPDLLKTCESIGAWTRGAMEPDADPHPDKARVLGIHLEGPFLSFEKKGAHNPYYLLPASGDVLSSLFEASGKTIRLLAMAPDIEGGMSLIHQIKTEPKLNGIRVSIAHTACGYELAKKAFEEGADHVTHLFNAMAPFGHREPGVIGAAMDTKSCYVELIGDGIHVADSVVRAAFAMFTDERIVLISDTMRATGLGDGTYHQGGMEVNVAGRHARLKNGTIAGSVTNLMQGLRSVVAMGIPLESAVRAASINPAKSLGLQDQIGSIEVGKLGDCVLLDQKLNVVQVIKGGKIIG